MLTILYSIITIGCLGLFAGVVLAYASKKFSVRIDPNLEKIVEVLPGSNCGACGYASCFEAGKAVLKRTASINVCIPGGQDTAMAIAEIIGGNDKVAAAVSRIAVVQCRGTKEAAKNKFVYHGVESCHACGLVAGGHKSCSFGCLGQGDCVRVCPFDAISMGSSGLPIVNESKCTGCNKCVIECPRDIIVLIPRVQEVYLGCISRDKAKKVREVCSVGCLSCSLCAKPAITPDGHITMENNLPEIHWGKDKDLKNLLVNAITKCPNKCFIVRNNG